MIKTLYKAQEPFMEVKHGHGYQGVLMYDDIEDKVQCHICGLWYVNVGSHTNQKHKVHADEYKMRYGLTLRTALCSVGLSNRRREATNKAIENGTIRPDIASKKASFNNQKKRSYRQIGTQTNQYYNKNGLCDLQIVTRYNVVKSIVGHEPFMSEIIQYDKKLYHSGIVPRYGNLENFKKNLMIVAVKLPPLNKIESTDLIASLRKFAHENKRTPRVTDFAPKHKPFYRAFGSWSNALRTAGIK